MGTTVEERLALLRVYRWVLVAASGWVNCSIFKAVEVDYARGGLMWNQFHAIQPA